MPPTTTTTTLPRQPPTPTPILIPRPPLTNPLDPTLLQTLQTALLTPQTIKRLRTTLETETQAEHWQEKVKERTMQLLGSRECWKWEELVRVVVQEARGVEEEEEEDDEEDDDDEEEDGGGGEGREKEEEGKEGREGKKVDIKIPEKAVVEAAKVVRGVLETRVELEPEGKGFWD